MFFLLGENFAKMLARIFTILHLLNKVICHWVFFSHGGKFLQRRQHYKNAKITPTRKISMLTVKGPHFTSPITGLLLINNNIYLCFYLTCHEFQEKKAMEKIQQVKSREKNILLQNINQLEDAPEEEEGGGALQHLPLSPDGKYLVLTATDESESLPDSHDFVQPMKTLDIRTNNQPTDEITVEDDGETEA